MLSPVRTEGVVMMTGHGIHLTVGGEAGVAVGPAVQGGGHQCTEVLDQGHVAQD